MKYANPTVLVVLRDLRNLTAEIETFCTKPIDADGNR